jgi:ligand-binding sensor domain-containing protein/serine phosphatase RsbU (regulator of sigma subunit)
MMMRLFFRIFFLCLYTGGICLFFENASIAQHYNFKGYSVEDGLSQSQVYSICQDKKGNLWIGTVSGGVCKYDGLGFINYTSKEGLADNIVTSIVEDKKGNLWMGTYGGLSKFDGKQFKNYTEKDGLCNNQVYKIIEDRQGNIWIATGGGGVSKFDGNHFTNYTEKEGLASNIVWTIVQDHMGDIWFGTQKGLSRFDGKKFATFSKKDGLIADIVYSLYEDRTQHLWIGTLKGLSCLYKKAFTNFDSRDGLVYNSVWSIAEDRSGHIWLGTTGGLSQFNKSTFVNYTTDQGLSNNTIWCIKEDREGNLWFGTNGGGIDKYANRCFVSYSEADGLNNDIVNAIYKDRQGDTWFGTANGVTRSKGGAMFSMEEKQGLVNKRVWSMLQDNEDRMWFATYKGVSVYDGKKFRNFTEKDGLSANNVYAILQDKKGILWFGTNDGISIYDGKHFYSYNIKDGLPDKVVRSVFEDHEGFLWFATNSGVVKLLSCNNDFSQPRFLTLTTKDGLVNNKVIAIAEDKKGAMWFGTNGGINVYKSKENKKAIVDTITVYDGLSNDGIVLLKFDKKGNLWVGTSKGIGKMDMLKYQTNGKKSIKNYTKSEGFSGVECNQNAVYEDHQGHLWFGTIKGAIRYTAQEDKLNQVAPATHISNIRLFFENMDLMQQGKDPNLVLSHKKNHLTFDYIGISLAVPEKVRYKYILEGLDKFWSPVTKETHVTYSTLPPGDYTFKVKACNNDDVWNELPQTFSFSITPPIWQRPWFIVFCIVAVVAIVYILVRLRLRSLIKQQALLEEKVELRTKELKEEKEKVEEINLEVIAQKEIIEGKNKDITDSIHYAKRIQEAILPSRSLIVKALPQSFVLFRPKDIVSGDFYWFASQQNKVLMAAVDCTGHGVPGAFMSMIGNTLLNEIVLEKGMVNPAEILNNLHEGVRQSLKQNLDDAETNDGMDVALCCLDLDNLELSYAAAYRPLYHLSDGALKEIKGDKYAIGGSHIEEKRRFTNNVIKIKKGDTIYLFTDGYADQFGGPDGKKFLSKRFQEMLLSINNLPMSEQEIILDKKIREWRGAEEQVDDILVIGIKME